MNAKPTLPSTWVPPTPYAGPSPVRSGTLKLDGNEGSLPDPELLASLAGEDPAILRAYPDARELEVEIADSLGVEPGRVVVTAGADDALDRTFRAFLRPGRSAVLPVPTFEMMYRFAAATGGEVKTVPWGDTFPVEGIIQALHSDVALVAIVSPNNPTGLIIAPHELERLSEAAPHSVILLDHVYADYADRDLTEFASELANVVTVRTFSKAWGLAGCRVGYAVASSEIAGVLRNVGNPYPVSSLSLVTARRRFREGGKGREEHVRAVKEAREKLAAMLTGLGAEPPPSQGNFLFADFGTRATFVHRALASLGIRVRRFPHRPEVASGLRITVPEREGDLERLGSGLRTTLNPDALLFDLDGVLADVEGSYRRCVLETVESFGGKMSRAELERAVQAGEANNDWVLTRRILAGEGIDVSLEEVTSRFQERYLGTPEQPGLRASENLLIAPEFLIRLASRYPLGIVTGRPREEAAWFLERQGIADLFRVVVCMEDAPLKPDPAPVRLALTRLGLQTAWFLGDTPDDVRAATAADALPLGVVAPGDDPQTATAALEGAGAAVVLNDLACLEELLP
jgi:histidinol-phosphate aminotransferase